MSVYHQEQKGLIDTVVAKPIISDFTYADFKKLKDPRQSYSTPLAVIAHIDVNAFFAQVEQLKHGFTKNDPVVCVQWWSIIAVSYAARDYGIGRMDSLKDAIKKCPHIVPLHTSVFRKGENFWRNVNTCNPDEFPDPANHKVSLDPYRRESRKMQRIFRDNCKNVEKASVDESFFDLGPDVYNKALELFPQLRELQDKAEDDDKLPPIPDKLPECCLKLRGVVVPTTEEMSLLKDEGQPQYCVHDWDDIFIMIGSIITMHIRKKVEEALGYTTSCGIARVKTVAKLASGFKKPDNQTIVRAGAIPEFLKNFDLADMWGLGGKSGSYINSKLDVPTEKENIIAFIRDNFTLEELTGRLEGDTALASMVYQIVRGELYSPLTEKKDPSMCSAKRFRGETVKTKADCVEWLRVFAADLSQRIKEINDEEFAEFHLANENRAGNLNESLMKIKCPKLLSLMYYAITTRISRTKQMPLPITSLDNIENVILENAIKLLDEVVNAAEHESMELFPIGRMSLTVSKFEVVNGLNFIDSFFKTKPIKKGHKTDSEEIVPTFNNENEENVSAFNYMSRKSAKKPTPPRNDIQRLLKSKLSKDEPQLLLLSNDRQQWKNEPHEQDGAVTEKTESEATDLNLEDHFLTSDNNWPKVERNFADIDVKKFFCDECNRVIINESDNPKFITEHQDFHFALKYSQMLNGENVTRSFLNEKLTVLPLIGSSENDEDGKHAQEVLDLTVSPPQSPKLKPPIIKGSSSSSSRRKSNSGSSKSSKRAKLSKGQSRLPF